MVRINDRARVLSEEEWNRDECHDSVVEPIDKDQLIEEDDHMVEMESLIDRQRIERADLNRLESSYRIREHNQSIGIRMEHDPHVTEHVDTEPPSSSAGS